MLAIVRIRPNEVTVSEPDDFHEIYDARTRYDKSSFFQRFKLYGEDNIFSTENYDEHQAKKRRLASSYSKTNVTIVFEVMVRERITTLLDQVARMPGGVVGFFFYSIASRWTS